MIRFAVRLILAVFIATGPFIRPATSRTLNPQPPPPPPSYGWSGWYAGLSGGYGWGSSSQADAGIPCAFLATCEETFDGSYSSKGAILGGTLGYSWQQGAWVAGLEGDYSWSHVAGSSDNCGANSSAPHACGANMESFGTFRARLGYAHGFDRRVASLCDGRASRSLTSSLGMHSGRRRAAISAPVGRSAAAWRPS